MTDPWLGIQEKYRNSVVQVIVTLGDYQIIRPYLLPEDKSSRGSGFIIDVEEGIVVTNAHVVSNAISIRGKIQYFGKKVFNLTLISIIREKDIAICRFSPDDISLIRDVCISMPLGDNMKLQETDNVMTIGYPLGQEQIKFTTGIISGFHPNIEEGSTEDKYVREEEKPSYIQITAAINPGNSGGPLLNIRGEVVGINAAGYLFAQNIGYAIGTRTLLSFYSQLISPLLINSKSVYIVPLPLYDFNWDRTNKTFLQTIGKTSSQGIYVREVYPKSFLDHLQKGDIIHSISYTDPFSSSGIYDLGVNSKRKNNLSKLSFLNKVTSGVEITYEIDSFGDIQFPVNGGKSRRITLKELFDMIPFNTKVSLGITRNGKKYALDSYYNSIDCPMITGIYQKFQPPSYEIFSGIVVSNLTLNHIAEYDKFRQYEHFLCNGKRYDTYVVINQIFPETSISLLESFKVGDILVRINDFEINSIEDVSNILGKLTESIITLESKNGSIFLIEKSQMILEDHHMIETFGINYAYKVK
jgi:S1-C subfamily serine protease